MCTQEQTIKAHNRESRLTEILATLLTVVGCALLIAGFIVPPSGEIHSSILVSFGEIMTFVAALLGINARFKSIINDIIKRNGKI